MVGVRNTVVPGLCWLGHRDVRGLAATLPLHFVKVGRWPVACGLWATQHSSDIAALEPGTCVTGLQLYKLVTKQPTHLFLSSSCPAAKKGLLPSWRSPGQLVNPSGAVKANGRCTPPLTTLDWLLRRRIASARNSMSCLHLATDVLVVTTRFAGPRQFEVFACMQDAAGSEGLAYVVGAMTSPRQPG